MHFGMKNYLKSTHNHTAKHALNWTCLAFFPSIWVMLVGVGWVVVFTLGLFFFCLWLPSAHQLILHLPFTLRLVSRAAPPSQLNQPRAEQLSWGGRASLCLFNLHSVGTTAISACCFWRWIGWNESVSRVFLAWLVRWNGCPWKMLPTWQFMQDFCRMFKVIFVGMGVGRTCLPFQLDLVSMAHSIFFDMGEFRYECSAWFYLNYIFNILLYSTTLPCFANSILGVLPC